MPVVQLTHHDPAGLDAALRPRDDLLVLERECGPGVFTGTGDDTEGPWREWTRTVATDEAAGTATETITFLIAVPHWAWLVQLLLRRPVRSGVSIQSRPVWCPITRLSARDVTVLGLCATMSIVAGFLGALLGQTIAYIADDFGGGTRSQAIVLSVIRLGAVITVVATAAADRRGRRPLLQGCLMASAIACVLTAAAPNLATVTVLQLIARGLVAAASFIIPIVLAEELPAAARSYGIGLMLLPGGLGAGMVLWFLPVVDIAPWAWRLLFLLAVGALYVIWVTVRRLPESRRFAEVDHAPPARSRQHIRRSRLVVLAVGIYLLNIFTAPTQQLQTDYLKNTRGLSATLVAVFLIATNTWGVIGVVVGAQLADRRSRRLAAAIGLIGLAVGNTLMFQFAGWPMWLFSTIGSAVGAAVVPSLGAILPEMFPTLRRGAANGVLNAMGVLGSVTGLLIVGRFVQNHVYGPTIAKLAICPLIVAVLMCFIPETSGRELEDVNLESADS